MPKKREGQISTWLVSEPTPEGDRVRVAKHGEEGADHAVSYYRVVEQAAQTLSWLEMEPHTGRTHQLRVHAAHIGCPIIGDPKYFEADPNWDFPGGIQNRLHLHARRIVIPHPDRGVIDVTAPLPPHMRQSWNLLGFDEQSAGDEGVSTASGTLDRRDAVDLAAVVIMIVLTFSWGLNGVAAKLSNAGFNPVFLNLARSAIAGVLVFLWCRYRGIRLFDRDGTLPAGLLAGLLFGAEFTCIFVGLDYTTRRAQHADGQHHAVLGAGRRPFPARRENVACASSLGWCWHSLASSWSSPTSSACRRLRRSLATC